MFAWRGRDRRLSKDDEGLAESSKSWIDIAMTQMLPRFSPTTMSSLSLPRM
jgi:hypothetical protein